MIQVPFYLRRLPTAAPASAFLLLSQDVEELLRFCVRLNVDPLPRIYAVAHGFLVVLDRQQPGFSEKPDFWPAIRLRQLSDNLLMPADAELAPELLDDEAKGLVRDYGLVFLPGGVVLEFAPDQQVPLSKLLMVDRVERRDWQSLPNPRELADRISEIVLDRPPIDTDELLPPPGDIGLEDPLLPGESAPTRMLGQAAVTAGKGLMAFGQIPGLGSLAKWGASLVQKGLSLAPSLSESLLGRQETALRALLREFREGSLDRALRRALPLGTDSNRGAVPAIGFRLPFHNLFYSLANILGGSGRGPVSIWFGGFDVQRELADEYRKAAEAATRRGDYRRAAFIYAKLLRDYRLAAHVLGQGGLHRDAATLYLEKVGDLLAAAREFEAAGEADRALQLYRQRDEHVLAGDLLRRIGEEEEAVAEFIVAADKLAAAGQQLPAGELILTKTERAGLAATYWAAGWSLRERSHLSWNAVPCAVRLARLYADEKQTDELLKLVDEAERYFAHPGDEAETGQFFNEIAQLAEQPPLAPVRSELRDRALLMLAGKLRKRAEVEKRPGSIVSDLLGHNRAWAAPLVSDAAFAFRAAVGHVSNVPEAAERAQGERVTRVQVHQGTVTAVAHAPETGDVFLGFANGAVYCFRAASGEQFKLPYYHLPVEGLATTADGSFVLAVRHQPPNGYLAGYRRSATGAFEPTEGRVLDEEQEIFVAPFIGADPVTAVLLTEGRLQLLTGSRLVPTATTRMLYSDYMALLLPRAKHPPWHVLTYMGSLCCHTIDASGNVLVEDALVVHHITPHRSGYQHVWKFRTRSGSPLRLMFPSWLMTAADRLELAGVDDDGVAHWAAFSLTEERTESRGTLNKTAACSSNQSEPYVAAGLVRPGLVAAVTRSRIYWLRAGVKGFGWHDTVRVELPNAVACFPSSQTGELLVVCSDGVVARVPLPS